MLTQDKPKKNIKQIIKDSFEKPIESKAQNNFSMIPLQDRISDIAASTFQTLPEIKEENTQEEKISKPKRLRRKKNK